jgi:hypothetical protein
MSINVWVDDAPGNNWQKALYWSSSSSVRSFRCWTNVFNIIPKWPCGPPNAVTEWRITARKKDMWRRKVKVVLMAWIYHTPFTMPIPYPKLQQIDHHEKNTTCTDHHPDIRPGLFTILL